MTTTNWKDRFDEKFAQIKEYSRGEYIISDITGSKFVVHCDDTGKAISAGGLESVKDFIEILLHEQKQNIITLIENENTDFTTKSYTEGVTIFKQALLGKLRSK